MSESTTASCCCTFTIPGTQAPIAPYVVSIGGLQGIVELNGTGVIDISTSGNTINFGLSAGAGLGTVTQVAASSSTSNLVIGGSPINTFGTLTFALAGNCGSIAGLVMAADQLIYSTGPGVFVSASLTAYARTLLDDANITAAQTTLGVLIGTNVQAWSSDLDSFVTNASWAATTLTLNGSLVVATDLSVSGNQVVNGNSQIDGDLTVNGTALASFFSGDGSSLTALSASQLTTGTVAVARGGTGIGSYTVGDLLYASGATTLSKLPDVLVGSFLRSGGVNTAPAWSTLRIPNASVTGDIFFSSTANTMSTLADVATGNVLLSGGVGVAPAWGKVTSSHVNNTIPTMVGGANSDLSSFLNDITFIGNVFFTAEVEFDGIVRDATAFEGNSSDLLTSTGTGTAWSSQIVVSTLTINSNLFLEGTVSGTTGNQIINKPNGTIKFAAGGATSILVTNSLAFAGTSFVQVTVNSNDATLRYCWAVATTGSFTVYANAAATSDCIVYWELKQIS